MAELSNFNINSDFSTFILRESGALDLNIPAGSPFGPGTKTWSSSKTLNKSAGGIIGTLTVAGARRPSTIFVMEADGFLFSIYATLSEGSIKLVCSVFAAASTYRLSAPINVTLDYMTYKNPHLVA